MGQPGTGPLAGLRIFDLTRILAGPTCTQFLGDLGAEVIKVERPGQGDDTRKWGPPYLKDVNGNDTHESAYYLSANRNKRSLSLDISLPEGQELAKRIIAGCDILIENFKVGGLAKFGLSYDDLRDEFPGLIYCSITGFGQTGPYAARAGYDYLAQGMGGIMSLTGEPDGTPSKVGVGIADVVCGLYAANAVLAALRHRDKTGEGQYIDLALLDSQVSWLVNEGLNYLTSGKVPKRPGNDHPNIVPYTVVPASDGHFILAVGNDSQFARFCDLAGAPELADDPRFKTNPDRSLNRADLYAILPTLTVKKSSEEWLEALAILKVPAGPINNLQQVFDDPQIRERGMKLEMDYPGSETGKVNLIANPVRFSKTPVTYRRPPPRLGQDSDALLQELLSLDESDIARLRGRGVV